MDAKYRSNLDMPSSPKFFHARSSSYTRRSTALIVCFLIGFVGFIIGFIVISRQNLGYRCKYGKPRSVSVVWEKNGNGGGGGGNGNGVVSDRDPKRHKVMGFVGIQTGFGSSGRRRSLRKTWMPSDHQGLQRYNFISPFSVTYIINFYMYIYIYTHTIIGFSFCFDALIYNM